MYLILVRMSAQNLDKLLKICLRWNKYSCSLPVVTQVYSRISSDLRCYGAELIAVVDIKVPIVRKDFGRQTENFSRN